MSEIFIPGVTSRFNSQEIIENLMRLERIPRDRAVSTIERLEAERGFWQDVGRRTNALRDSSRALFGFQNPFSDRIARSSDEMTLMATARRDAPEQERTFTVRQTAQADRFLSSPLEQNFRVESGTYTFTVGDEEISFEFRGGTLREFSEALNRRGRDTLRASLITVQPGTTSLLIESRVTGEENRLRFSGAATGLGEAIGMIGRVNDSSQEFTNNTIRVNAGSSSEIPMPFQVTPGGNWILRLETSTEIRPQEVNVAVPPPGPSIPSAGSVSLGGIVIQNHDTSIDLPVWTPPAQPRRHDDMNMLSLRFSDGTSIQLPPMVDSRGFNTNQFDLSAIAAGRNIVALSVVNSNTHRDISIRDVQIFDPNTLGGVVPLNPVSTARDAIVSMEGIEVRRPTNEIDDLVPGVTLNVRGASDRPVTLRIEPDREGIKDAIISFVGNYNRLMTEINILTRNDPRIIDEITWLTREEREDYRNRLGVFAGDSTLNHLRNNLLRIVTTSYPTSEGPNLALLAQIGIGTDVRRSGSAGGVDASRLRGYLEIDERVLDAAIASNLVAIRQLFGNNIEGGLTDSGVAFAMDALTRPFTESGGIIAQKNQTMNSRIAQEERRIGTLDRQLAAREMQLRREYAQMEAAFNRMEQMTTSLDRFQNQNSR